jgi:hypothetical protein
MEEKVQDEIFDLTDYDWIFDLTDYDWTLE